MGRTMIVWCPDWPVVSMLATTEGVTAGAPIAVMQTGEVFACSEAARSAGVRRGMRRRDASAVCPELVVLDRAPETEMTAFARVLEVIEERCASVMPVRPGLCAVSTGSRFHGGEEQMAAVVAEQVVAAGVWDCRFGVADDLFTAELAARRSAIQQCHVVPVEESPAFLAGLRVDVLAEAEGGDDDGATRHLVGLLRRLGIRRLGEFAALSSGDVVTRFGAAGARLHRLAGGGDRRLTGPRAPAVSLEQSVRFEPALHHAEPVVFSSRRCAEQVIGDLDRLGLVCPQIRIEVYGEGSWLSSRSWAHPRWFTSRDLIDRLHWQLQPTAIRRHSGDGSQRGDDPQESGRMSTVEGEPEPVVEVRFVPERTEATGDHSDGFFGADTDERIEVGISRLQGLLGPDAVLRPAVAGGRDPRRRQQLAPWGFADPDRRPGRGAASGPAAARGGVPRPPDLPWPGRIPPPAPSTVFARPAEATVRDGDGNPVQISDRGVLSGEPRWIEASTPTPGADGAPPAGEIMIDSWAGPWPADESWWDPAAARKVTRCQLVAADGSAWLAAEADGRWWLEARYD